MSTSYSIPAQTTTIQTEVARSKFIATVYHVESVEAARATLVHHRSSMSDASHHVYAFRIGFGSSVVEGLSDDGEPSGTSGPPIMSVLRGSKFGDTLIVVTRYFGGTLLGTGGLVRAYSEAAALAIKVCPASLKIEYARLLVLFEYSAFTLLKRLLSEFDADIVNETFSESIELEVTVPALHAQALTEAIMNLTAGSAFVEHLN